MSSVSDSHVYIADVSAYQDGFNIEQAHQQGLGACVAKVTEGNGPGGEDWDVANKNFARDMYNRATSLGMLFGFYHYLRAGSGIEQCDYFLDQVNRITGHGVTGHLVQLDFEAEDVIFGNAFDFSRRFYARTGNHPLFLYTGRWFWTEERLGPMTYGSGQQISPYLWSAPNSTNGGSFYPGSYPGDDSVLWNGYGPWPNLTIMQYTDKGHTGGLLNVDLNCFRGPMSQLRKLAGIMDPPPPPVINPPHVPIPPPPVVVIPAPTSAPIPTTEPNPTMATTVKPAPKLSDELKKITAQLQHIINIIEDEGQHIVHDIIKEFP